MEKIEGQKAEIGEPGLGQKNKSGEQEEKKEDKKKESGSKEDVSTQRFMTRSKKGNKIRVTKPNDPPNRSERRKHQATQLRKPRVTPGPKSQRSNTPGAFGKSPMV